MKQKKIHSKAFEYYFIKIWIGFSIFATKSFSLKYRDFSDTYEIDKCLDLAQAFTSVTLIFCKIEPGELYVESLLSNNISAIILTNISNYLTSAYDLRMFPNFIVFTGSLSKQDTADCILSTVHEDLLTSKARVIICDVSGDSGTSPSLEPDAWWTVGSANALYVAKSHCWAVSPPHFFDRRFTLVPKCRGLEDFWTSDDPHLPDLQGQLIEAVSFHRPVTTIINRNESDPQKRYDGIEINIFKVLAEQLNFTWRLNELENDSDKWGQLEGGCWKGGIMEALTTGGAEVGFATLWVSSMQTPYLDYTTSWLNIELIFLVPKPELVGNSFSSLLRPFSSAVWAGVIAALILFPLALWTSQRLHSGLHLNAHNSGFSVLQCFLYTLGMITGGSGRLGDAGGITRSSRDHAWESGRELVQESSKESGWKITRESSRESGRSPARPLVACWYLSALLLCNCYVSNIVADLTLPLFTPKIDTVRQLVEQRFAWGRTHPEDTLEKHLDFQKYWHRKFAESFIVYDEADLSRLIRAKKFALFAQQIQRTNYILTDGPIEDGLAGILRVMEERIRSYRCAIAVRKNSPLLTIMNIVVSRMMESGLMQHIKDDSVRRYKNPAYDKIYLDISPGFHSDTVALTLDHYKYMFIILVIGWCLASLCFFFELYIYKLYDY